MVADPPRPDMGDRPAAPQAGARRRIAKHLNGLFVFGEAPAVPPTNNPAKRGPRPAATSRKINGGTRSEDGDVTKMTLASRFGTRRALHLNPLPHCRRLLAPHEFER